LSVDIRFAYKVGGVNDNGEFLTADFFSDSIDTIKKRKQGGSQAE
jgi:hypothetical protein